jgi:hypothetical protein
MHAAEAGDSDSGSEANETASDGDYEDDKDM